MEVQAKTNNIRISPRKVRIVADTVRHMDVVNAVATLSLIRKRAAKVLLKTMKSAIANAVHNAKLAEDTLKIVKLEVNEGAFLKRFRPSTRGRVHPYKKRSAKITVILTGVTVK
jgi:large subunit ribosomal protein L22